MRVFISFLYLGALLATLASCSKEQLAEQMNKAKDSLSSAQKSISENVSQATSQVAEQVVSDGQATIKLDSDVAISSSYINLIHMKERGSVLQLRSYLDAKTETFPSYFFQANTSATSLASLGGQSVSGNIFVKKSATDPTWMNQPDQPVTLALESSNEGKLKGKFSTGQVSGPDGKQVSITGTFEAIIEGGE